MTPPCSFTDHFVHSAHVDGDFLKDNLSKRSDAPASVLNREMTEQALGATVTVHLPQTPQVPDRKGSKAQLHHRKQECAW